MKEIINFFTSHPFIFGLAIGLLIALFVWIKEILKRRDLRAELKKLKESLYTKMEIDAKGHQTREGELEKLRKENENLRVTVKGLQQKPGRSEIRLLHVYDKAIHAMLGRAPGFAATWEMVLKEAQDEVEETDTGIKAFVRKAFVPLKGPEQEESTTNAKLINYEEDKD